MSEFESSADTQGDRGGNDLHFFKTTGFKVGTLALLAIPLGFGAFLFFGFHSVAWLPTPLRLVPYSVLMGCILMAVYQKSQGAGLKDAIQACLMTGGLAGLMSIVAFYMLLIVVAAGGVH